MDSSLVISRLIGDHPEHQQGMDSLFHEADAGRVQLLGSTLLLTEVLGGGYDQPVDIATEARIFRILDNPKVLTLVQVTRQVAAQARDYRRSYRLKTPDALHLATAVFAGADMFMTIDNDFPIGATVGGVEVLLPASAFGAEVLPATGVE